MRVLYTVRDYPRIIEQINNIMYGSGKKEGNKGNNIGKPTENKAVKLAELMTVKTAIDKAVKQIPEEYRMYIFENVAYKIPYPNIAHRNTWTNWRVRFMYYVAKNLNLI